MKNISAALVAFQSECPSVPFNATNPHFRSRYATLAAIHDVIKPLLAKHSLAVLQFPITRENRAGCVTRIVHSSGEALEYEFTVPLQKNDPQGACSAVTYARRYGLSGALGIVTEEDTDGEAAMGRSTAVAKPMQQPAPRESKKASPMSPANKTKLAYAARERIKELGDESLSAVEIIRAVAHRLARASETELTDSDFERAFSMVQDFEPGGAA